MGLNLETLHPLVLHGLEVVYQRFDEPRDSRRKLVQHNREHSEWVTWRVIRILEAAEKACPGLIGDDLMVLGQIAGANHDRAQLWQEADGPHGRVYRKRVPGESEGQSANETAADMRGWGYEPLAISLVGDAITVTACVIDGPNHTVMQPALCFDSHPVIRAVALADLGAAGMGGPQQFLQEGERLFRESELDIERMLRALSHRGELPTSISDSYKQRALTWLGSQVLFAHGRQARFKQELGDLPEPAKEAVRALFCHFSDSIQAAKERVTRYRDLGWWEIAQGMGYDLTHLPS